MTGSAVLFYWSGRELWKFFVLLWKNFFLTSLIEIIALLNKKCRISILQCAMVSVLGVISSVGHATNFTLDMLASAKAQLKKLLVICYIV